MFLKLEYILQFLSIFSSISQKAVIIIIDSIVELRKYIDSELILICMFLLKFNFFLLVVWVISQ